MNKKKPELKELSIDELDMVSGGEWTAPNSDGSNNQCPFCMEWINIGDYADHIYWCSQGLTEPPSGVERKPDKQPGQAVYIFEDYDTPL